MPNATTGALAQPTVTPNDGYSFCARILLLASLDPATGISEATDVLAEVIAYRGSTLHETTDWQGRHCWAGWECEHVKGSACLQLYLGGEEPAGAWDWTCADTVLRIASFLLDSAEDLSPDLVDEAEKWAREAVVS